MVADGVDASGLDVRQLAVGSATVVSSNLRSSLVIFAVAFVYTLVAALAIQTVILPMLLPQLHAGHGLMVGHDSVGFHAMADEMAKRIQVQGWGEWKLVPNLQGVVGITAAVYAITGVHEPLVMIPVYAALYALSVTCVYRSIRILTGSEIGAWIGAAAFLLFPSATMIYADLHKDAWACAGILLLFVSCVDLQLSKRPRSLTLVYFVLVAAFALGLIWVVRPYMVKLMLGGSSLGLIALIVTNFIRRSDWRKELRKYVGYLLLLLMMAAISLSSTAPLMDAPVRMPTFIIKSNRTSGPAKASFASENLVLRHTIGAVLSVREGVVQTPGGSVVDADVRFPSVQAFILYLPRALQIGLLAPFPDMWFEHGMTPGARMMRLVSGMEMSIAYLLLLGWIFLIPSIRRDRMSAFLFVTVTCFALIGVMSLAMPNIGTLYRMRYPMFMLVVGLGAAGWAILLAKIRARNKPA